MNDFKVELVEEHEDGGATFRIEASAETMRFMFESFMKLAIVNGIESAEQETEDWIKNNQQNSVISAAEEIEILLRTWETSDELDYEPVIRASRERLTDAIDEMRYSEIKKSFE
jgi:hypothetical protein